MTREDRAQRWLADYFDQYGKHGGADELRDGRMITMTSITAVNAMLAFADAEAAAMRERAADVCDQISSYAKKQGLPQISAGANSCSEFIRSLPVGEGQ